MQNFRLVDFNNSEVIERNFGNYRGNISMKKCRYCGKELNSNLLNCYFFK